MMNRKTKKNGQQTHSTCVAILRAEIAPIYLQIVLARFRDCRVASDKISEIDPVFNMRQPFTSFPVNLMVSVLLCVSVYVIVCHLVSPFGCALLTTDYSGSYLFRLPYNDFQFVLNFNLIPVIQVFRLLLITFIMVILVQCSHYVSLPLLNCTCFVGGPLTFHFHSENSALYI